MKSFWRGNLFPFKISVAKKFGLLYFGFFFPCLVMHLLATTPFYFFYLFIVGGSKHLFIMFGWGSGGTNSGGIFFTIYLLHGIHYFSGYHFIFPSFFWDPAGNFMLCAASCSVVGLVGCIGFLSDTFILYFLWPKICFSTACWSE